MATGITYFSQGGGVSSFTGLGNSTIPGSQQLTNVIVAAGTSRCYAATQVLTVAGNGSMFLVMNGGAVDLTAGGMISFQPSSVVNHGGYLHAWISPGGPFCGTPMNPLVSGFPSPDAPSWAQEPSRDPFLRIYPNPAEEMVFIELTRTGSTGFTLEIYHTNGMRVMTRHCSGETKTGVSLTGWPAGIYVVCVRSEERSGYAKIVRQQP